MRKMLAFVLTFMLVFSAVAYAAPKGSDWVPPGQMKKMVRFDDLEDDHWAAQTIYELADSGKLKGYGNGKFMPNKPVTKLESLAMLFEAADAEAGDFEAADYGLYKGPDWGKGYYFWAMQNGAFGDSAKLFNANAAISRAEFAFYAANLEVDDDEFDWDAYENQASRFDDEDELGEYRNQIRWMNRNRLLIGDENGVFNGDGALKRCEAAMVMYRLRYFEYGDDSDPYASIFIEKDGECITSLEPVITITFSENIFDSDEDGKAFTENSEAEEVIDFEIYDDEEWKDVDFSRTSRTFEDDKEIWTIEADEDLSKDSKYKISLDKDDFYDDEGNNLTRDETESFFTCESYSITATYNVDEVFEDDWVGFTISVEANDEEGQDVEMVFGFADLPDWFAIEYYDDTWKSMTKDGDSYVYPEFELEDETIGFRAFIPTPGAYVIPVDFKSVSSEAKLFEFDPGIEIGRVALDGDSKGDAGNSVIYGLEDERQYRVTEIESGLVQYSTSDGSLEEDMADMEPLGDGVEIITGLYNDMEYLVEIPLSLEIHDVTESGFEDYDYEFEITSTPNDDAGKYVEANYLFDEDIILEYNNSSDGWTAIENDNPLEPWLFMDDDTSKFRIYLGDDNEMLFTVQFRLEGDGIILGQDSYEFYKE